MPCNLCKNIMPVSATHFKGKLLICGTCVKDVNPEKFEELSKDRTVYTFCPEMTHSSLLGYKLTTILRTCNIEDIWIFTKDGSPHCEQILTTLQEVAENVNFDKSKLRYFVTKKGRFSEITDKTIRKSRNIMEIEKLMSFNKLHKATEILMGKDGCPNDKKETFESILNHFEEEVQELKKGLEKNDWINVKEELGDILFNVFLFAKVAQNNKKFDIFDLFEKTSNKFIKNHKRIFEDKVIK
jgi:NTP pyrophosphatase (non-canonical NTP hydrolase)